MPPIQIQHHRTLFLSSHIPYSVSVTNIENPGSNNTSTFSRMFSATVHTKSFSHHTNTNSKPAKILDFFLVVFALEIDPFKRTQSTEIKPLCQFFFLCDCVINLLYR